MCVNIAHCYDGVMTFKMFQADAFLYREIQPKKKDINMFMHLSWNQEYARLKITHVCLMTLTLGGYLWRCSKS